MFPFLLWHFRLGHYGNKTIDQICTRFPYIQYLNKTACDIWHYAKHHKLPFSHSSTTSTAIFDLTHVDIWGPMSVIYVHGHKYFLSIVDDLSRHTWAFMMHLKGEIRTLLHNFIAYVKNQYGKTIKAIRSDNGLEFNYADFIMKMALLINEVVWKPHNKMPLLSENISTF